MVLPDMCGQPLSGAIDRLVGFAGDAVRKMLKASQG